MTEKHGLEMTDTKNKMEHGMRLKLGEERARSARVVERTREEKEREVGEKWESAVKELKRAQEAKIAETDSAWEKKIESIMAGKKEALVKEASKWEAALEKAVEEGEKRRIEEIRQLSDSGREEAEVREPYCTRFGRVSSPRVL